MSKRLNITVMLGGPSAEREVSLRSGAAVVQALQELGHCVRELDPADSHWTLAPETDAVFLALHGTYGEDGSVQARLDALGTPYTGCGAEASRIAFDKVATKRRCAAVGVATARWAVFSQPSARWPEGWTAPVVIKPARQGSSVGLMIVQAEEELEAALAQALSHDDTILMEERIVGREVTAGILDERALPVVEIRPRQGAYDYRNKYTAGATEYLVPAPLDPAVTARVQSDAVSVFDAIGGRGYGRVDFIVEASGRPVLLEVNTLPGMTELSLFPMAAKAAGIEFPALCQRMVELALRAASGASAKRPGGGGPT